MFTANICSLYTQCVYPNNVNLIPVTKWLCHFHEVVMPLREYNEEIQGGNHDRDQGKPKLLGTKIIFSEPIGFQHPHFL